MSYRPIRKTVFTLCIDDYAPEITALTFPLLEGYAAKIGAELVVIRERAWPDWPVAYEKMQVGRLARELGSEWCLFFDADVLVHPDTPDFTAMVEKDTVVHYGSDRSVLRWKPDGFMLRDGRDIGSANWMAVASDWCLDLWEPLDVPLEEALARILPHGVPAEHLIDDYTLTRNIARYGLKFKSVVDDLTPGEFFLFHAGYLMPREQKAAAMRLLLSLKSWGGEIEDAELAASGGDVL